MLQAASHDWQLQPMPMAGMMIRQGPQALSASGKSLNPMKPHNCFVVMIASTYRGGSMQGSTQ